jgi:3-hydroxyacyl-CoA dehydrogenase/enoyl-CoA hydratase/3-hydroxybutyryl-CoA epimerase
MGDFQLQIDEGIAILEFDQQNSKVNVLNSRTMEELAGILQNLSNKANSEVKGLLFKSKKEGTFIAGADIGELESVQSVEEAREKSRRGREILDLLEKLDIPTVAVINGACLGGGLEVALACQYRVAGFNEKVKIGLPEVNLGIIPGLGGTHRLPKLVGLTRALTMILGGTIISGKDGLRYGLIDRLFPDIRLAEESLVFIQGLLDGKEVVKRKGKKRLSQKFLEDTPLGRIVLFKGAKKNILKRTKGFYPAPLTALEVIRNTYGRDPDKGDAHESNGFATLAVTDVSKNLIKVYSLNEEFKKISWVGDSIKPVPINKCGIVGAGIMGGGIAQLLSYYDIPTRIKDINNDALKGALRTAAGIFKSALRRRRLRKHHVINKMNLISPTLTYQGFENSDLIVETVVEDIDVKQKVFKELSKVTSSEAILASNTSSLPIIQIGQGSRSPDKVVGLHFFNPVHRMPLVEVIKSRETSEETLATAIAFARRLRKVVVVVKDVPGFLINRILFAYMNEAAFLIDEGMKTEQVDGITRNFGMPMGPLELIDEVGIDVGFKVAKTLEKAYGERMHIASIFEKVVEKGYMGRKTQEGFYVYKGKKKTPNSRVYRMAASSKGPIPDEVVLKRMLYIMINEGARCLEENVVDRPHSVDIGMIMGAGFPPFRGGLLRYADYVGIENIVRDLEEFEKETGGKRFKPCGYLRDRAKKMETFY